MDLICGKCKKVFSNKSNLTRHQKNKVNCDQLLIKKNYTCNICNKLFSSDACLKYHKNKKTPCKPFIEVLKEENEKLKTSIITTNNNNQVKSNNTTTSNSNNKVTNYNIYINSNDPNLKDNFNSNFKPFNYQQIESILKYVNIKDNEQIQLLNIDKNHCKDFILDNTEEISDLFKILYANFKYLPCILFRLDEYKFGDIYVKDNIDNIDAINILDNSKLLFIIYETFSLLIDDYSDFINQKLKKYYKDFIKHYNSGIFTDLNKDHVKKFLSDIKTKLRNHVIELYDDLNLLYKRDVKKLNDKDNKYTEYLKIKNQESNNINIIKPNKKINDDDIDNINKILIRLKSYGNKITVYGNLTLFKYDYFIIALFEFFLNNYYFSNKDLSNIKLEKNKLYEFDVKDNKWFNITLEFFVENFINELNDEIISRKMCYDIKTELFVEDKNRVLDICDAIEGSNIYLFLEGIIRYLFKFKTVENISIISKSIVTI